MFQIRQRRNKFVILFNMMELIFHSTVREIRKDNRNPIVGLLYAILQAFLFVAGFYAMIVVLSGGRAVSLGDPLLYTMSGVFPFLTFTKATAAVFSSGGASSALLKHEPLNPMILVVAAALGSLYIQILSMILILAGYHLLITPIEIDNYFGCLNMLMAAWLSGAAFGLVFLAIKPWAPKAISIIQSLFQRINMLASGKMFLANAMPSAFISAVSWNPLFHAIDQTRGYMFTNYTPQHTSSMYPYYFIAGCCVFGVLAEYFNSKYVSASWHAAN